MIFKCYITKYVHIFKICHILYNLFFYVVKSTFLICYQLKIGKNFDRCEYKNVIIHSMYLSLIEKNIELCKERVI